MRYASFFNEILGCTDSKQVFEYLVNNLNDSIRSWDYFVNWDKVLGNIKDLEIDLNTLNYLVGKQDVETEFKRLLGKQPDIARLVPVLLACRDSNFKILTDFSSGDLQYENFSFQHKTILTSEDIDKACRFAKKTGVLELFKNKNIKSVPDYVLGVEVGLDTNGRKNRGGTAMENIVEGLLISICHEHGLSFIPAATSNDVKSKWGIHLHVDKSNRCFDFAVKSGDELYLIETNYYGGGGSKLKSTAGEYKSLYDFLSANGYGFIWITDGLGWKETQRPLEEAFNHVDYILNLKMVTSGILAHILLNRL